MPISFVPAHLTHIVVASIYAIATVSITALEVFFIKSINSADIFFIVVQNVGIMGTSGYFASKISVSEKGLSETNLTK